MNELRNRRDKHLLDSEGRPLTSEQDVRHYLSMLEANANDEFPPFPEFWESSKWVNVSRSLDGKDFSGRLLVLDFWTFCCINCMHILPDLADLESLFPASSGLCVVGVHSAKFDHERNEDSIRQAIRRHQIHHPVLNDADASLWDILSVSCWPTLVVVSPTMKALTIFEGEGNRVALLSFVSTAMKFYEERHILVNKNPLPVVVENLGEDEVDRPSNGSTASSLKLSHPGKIAVSGKRIAVADSANHRIIVGALEEKLETSEIDELYCQVEYVIGGPSPGFEDCSFRSSCSSSSSSLAPLFRFPQGLVWYDDEGEEKLIVADTENHLVRIISFPKASKKGKVETLVGKPGVQGNDYEGGNPGIDQPISSPWDVCLAKSLDGRDVLFIAMAGIHQIWVYFFEHSIWHKNVFCPASTCRRFIGSGSEENRNNSYPPRAGLAQPSGICVGKSDAEPDVCSVALAKAPLMSNAPPVPKQTLALQGAPTPTPPPTHSGPPPPPPPSSGPPPPPPSRPPPPPSTGPSHKGAPPPPPPTSGPRPPPPPPTCGPRPPQPINSSSASKLLIYSLFIADAESSTVRDVDLKDGATRALVGGSKDPTDLFAYGDVDGCEIKAKLQHPLGVCWHPEREEVFVADSYNNKIKVIDPISKCCNVFWPTTASQQMLKEPGGIAFAGGGENDGGRIFIADSNNHRVLCLNTESKECKTVEFFVEKKLADDLSLKLPKRGVKEVNLDVQTVAKTKGNPTVVIDFQLYLQDGIKQTEDAQSFWWVEVGEVLHSIDYENSLRGVISILGKRRFWRRKVPLHLTGIHESSQEFSLKLNYVFFYCKGDDGVCAFDAVCVNIPFVIQDNSVDGVKNVIAVNNFLPL